MTPTISFLVAAALCIELRRRMTTRQIVRDGPLICRLVMSVIRSLDACSGAGERYSCGWPCAAANTSVPL